MQVDNKADICVLWFSVRKIEKKFSCFCVNKFFDVIRIRKKFFLTYQKMRLEFLKKKIQKNGFSFCFFLKIKWYFILNKKIEKMSVLFIFFEKIFFSVKQKVVKKWHVWNKKLLIKKIYHVENDQKKVKEVFFFYERCLFE